MRLPTETTLQEHLARVVRQHDRFPHYIEPYQRHKHDFSPMEQGLVQLALMASLAPVDSDTLHNWIRELPEEQREKTRIFLLQALTFARPFHQGVWLALLNHLQHYIPDEGAACIFPVWYQWGLQHHPDALLAALNHPDWSRWKSYGSVRKQAEFWVVAAQPIQHPECLRYLQNFLQAPDGEVREQAARTLLNLGWKPATRSQQARMAVALRNEKAIPHLASKMQHAISVVRFPNPKSLYTAADFEAFNAPEMGFFVAVMENIPQKSWEKVALIARYSSKYGQRARTLLEQQNSN
ncbi:hypothetical protein GCM10008938_23680 [Deinococcus roseus]|uniref:HEAT repeat domain-containing protein n=2 Tax=Deinococcus roseus TaxID=392414 RepID=A0ABQ2CZR3_9DEIO|nr:hypothetical protein GCM10008938_23680 [Deinococcus roseus]